MGLSPAEWGRVMSIRALALSLCVVLAAACGSTVPLPGGAVTSNTGDGLAMGSAVSGDPAAQAPGAPIGGGGGSPTGTGLTGSGASAPAGGGTGVSGTGTGTAAAAAAAGSGGSSNGATRVAMGPGVSGSEIKIGVDYVKGGEEFFESVGIPLAIGDTRAQARAVMKEINDDGGIAGRRLVPVDHGRDPTRAGSMTQLEQEACTAFTEDNKVFGVVSIQGHADLYPRCLAAADTVLMADAMIIDARLARATRDHVYLPSYWVADEIVRIQLERLIATRWLNKSSVIGAFYYANPVLDRIYAEVVIPTLARHGMEVKEKLVVSGTDQFQQYAAGVLKFRSEDIDRVYGLMTSPLIFMNEAESQRYRPGWSVHTGDGPGAFLQTTAPREQLKQVAGIGWAPVSDVDRARNPGPVSRNETRCMKIMRDANQDMSEPTVRLFAMQICDYFFFMEKAVPLGSSLTAAGLAEGAQALGRGYASPLGFATAFRPHWPGGGAAVRDLRYKTNCSCFQYTSPPIRVF